MKIINVGLGDRAYPIFIGYNILDKVGLYISRKINTSSKIVIITDTHVSKLYLDKCKTSLIKSGFNVQTIIVPSGEKYKNLNVAINIYKKLLKFKADRNTSILALGGGVIGDLTGFAAATYLRGIALIQVPTTLLSQVDSSVGGKVGVNLPEGKNLIGAFYQPKIVFIDCAVLATLPKREISAGLAEVIKYGIIKDFNFFNYLEKNIENILELKSDNLQKIIAISCKIKADVVEKDEKERNIRAILNFGHTIGHALETQTKYKKYKHGEAVSIGMIGAMKLAERLNYIKREDTDRIIKLLRKTNLPIKIKFKIPINKLVKSMELDKKASQDNIRFVLTKKIGHVTLKPINDKALIEYVLAELFD